MLKIAKNKNGKKISNKNIFYFFLGNRRTASIRAVGYVSLYVLTKRDLWSIIYEYPNAKNQLRERG